MVERKFSQSFASFELTMSDDLAHRIVTADIFFEEVNLHCYDNSLNYGNAVIQSGIMPVGAFASFKHGNLKEIYFRNTNAGSNGKIVAICTLREDA